jgi:hypothetical protein
MPTVRGRSEVKSFMAQVRTDGTNMLRGAARAAAKVVADEAKVLSISREVSAAVKVATRVEDDRIVALVQVKGPGAYIAPWLEYGTSAHFISVDESQRQGRSVGVINKSAKEAGGNHSLVIGGKFVGTTVLHPGARPHPFLRPALDLKQDEAIAAAQRYISARVMPSGIVTTASVGDEA